MQALRCECCLRFGQPLELSFNVYVVSCGVLIVPGLGFPQGNLYCRCCKTCFSRFFSSEEKGGVREGCADVQWLDPGVGCSRPLSGRSGSLWCLGMGSGKAASVQPQGTSCSRSFLSAFPAECNKGLERVQPPVLSQLVTRPNSSPPFAWSKLNLDNQKMCPHPSALSE